MEHKDERHRKTDVEANMEVAKISSDNENIAEALNAEEDNLELEVPEAGATFENPPDGGCRAWLIVLACALINSCVQIIQIGTNFTLMAITTETEEDRKAITTITEMFSKVSLLCSPLAAIMMVLLGYRVTAMAGSSLVAVNCLIASFVNSKHLEVIGFLIAGLAGAGVSLMRLSAVIPILEYFIKKRMRAVSLSNILALLFAIVVTIGVPLLVMMPSQQPAWKTMLRFQMVPAAVAFLAGATLKDLKLSMKDVRSQSLVSRVFGVEDLKFFKNIILYLVMAFIFMYSYGISLPVAKKLDLMTLTDVPDNSIVAHLSTLVAFPLGSLLGVLVAWLTKKCVTRTTAATTLLLAVLGCAALVAGVGSVVTVFVQKFDWMVVYLVLLGAVSAFNGSMLEVQLPDVFGRGNIRIVQGLFLFSVGLADLVSGQTIDLMETLKIVLIVGGTFCVVGGVVSLVGTRCQPKVTLVQDGPEGAGPGAASTVHPSANKNDGLEVRSLMRI